MYLLRRLTRFSKLDVIKAYSYGTDAGWVYKVELIDHLKQKI